MLHKCNRTMKKQLKKTAPLSLRGQSYLSLLRESPVGEKSKASGQRSQDFMREQQSSQPFLQTLSPSSLTRKTEKCPLQDPSHWASFHRAFGTLVVLSHLADHVTIFGVRGKRKSRIGVFGLVDNESLPHFILNRVCVTAPFTNQGCQLS